LIDGIELAGHHQKLKDELEKLHAQLARCDTVSGNERTDPIENDEDDSTLNETAVTGSRNSIAGLTENQARPVVGYSRADIDIEILHLDKLIKFVDSEFAPQKQKFTDLVADNDIRFDLLLLLFPPDSEVFFEDKISGLPMAGQVTLFPCHS